LQFLS
jgi:hypothetical protein